MVALLATLFLSVLPGADKFGVALMATNSSRTVGTGVRISKHLVLTAAHVVGDTLGNPQPLRCGDDLNLGVVVKVDKKKDLALVAFNGVCSAEIAVLASEDLAVGSALTTVGHPNGAFLAVTTGTVSSYSVIEAWSGLRYSLVSEAQIYPGCSGGPVLSDNGELVAIMTGRWCFRDEELVPVCYMTAVPASLVKAFLHAPASQAVQ